MNNPIVVVADIEAKDDDDEGQLHHPEELEEFIEIEQGQSDFNVQFQNEKVTIGDEVVVVDAGGNYLEEEHLVNQTEYIHHQQERYPKKQRISRTAIRTSVTGLEKKTFFTSKRIKKGLENKEYYRQPLVKGNTKYAMYYDRLINADGTSTEHYICKNYEKCGKIFHRRYLDALCSHMNECRSENLWHSEECSVNVIKELMAKVVVKDPAALIVMNSKAYLEHIEELSRIMVMRYSIGLTIGKDALPRRNDFLREVVKYSAEDESRMLPIIIREMVTNGCAIESLITRNEPAYQIVLVTHINNSWEMNRTVLKFDKLIEDNDPLSPMQLFNLLLNKYQIKPSPINKTYIVSELDNEEEQKDIHQTCIIHLLEELADRMVYYPLMKSEELGSVNGKLTQLRVLLRQLKDFEEMSRRDIKLRPIFTRFFSFQSTRMSHFHLARNWLMGLEEISYFLEHSDSTRICAIQREHADLATEENLQLLRSYVAVMEPIDDAIEIFQTTVNGPNSSVIIVELIEICNRIENLNGAIPIEGYDTEILQAFSDAILGLLGEIANKKINPKLAFCALYCDPLRIIHIEYFARFCSLEKVRNAVFVELENLETANEKGAVVKTAHSWLSYTEEAQHYEQLTMEEIFDAMEESGLGRDPQNYCPLAFWRIYENMYPSIARLAKQVLTVSASLASTWLAFEYFKPLELSLASHFEPEQVSRLIRLHSIHQQKELLKSRQGQAKEKELLPNLDVKNLDEKIKHERKRAKRKPIEKILVKESNEIELSCAKKRGRPRKKVKISIENESIATTDEQVDVITDDFH